MVQGISLIIPAHNEASWIGTCLDAVFASEALLGSAPVQVVLVANGCRDETAEIARNYRDTAQARGWALDVLELEQGGKLGALRAGEEAARFGTLAYLDADVVVGPDLLRQTAEALKREDALYASGRVSVSRARSAVTRAYARFYVQVPFMRQTAPGCGFFAVNAAGRALWQDWPDIISDDTFVRLTFPPERRIQVQDSYDWPLVEGLGNLIAVRRRQNAGVDELADRFPDLMDNDEKGGFTAASLARAIVKAPFGFLVYGFVAFCVKLTPGAADDWRRGR